MRSPFRFAAAVLIALALAITARAATLAVTVVSRAGQDLTTLAVAADAAKTDKFLNTGSQFVWINNGSGADITVTLNYGVGGTIDGQALPARVVTVTKAHSVLVGPFPTGLYNDANGYMSITYSAATTVTVCPLLLGN
jgi:hypothetical protein